MTLIHTAKRSALTAFAAVLLVAVAVGAAGAYLFLTRTPKAPPKGARLVYLGAAVACYEGAPQGPHRGSARV